MGPMAHFPNLWKANSATTAAPAEFSDSDSKHASESGGSWAKAGHKWAGIGDTEAEEKGEHRRDPVAKDGHHGEKSGSLKFQ